MLNSISQSEEDDLRCAKNIILFGLIKNPSEAVQIVGVTYSPWAITSIKSPSEAVQLIAINGDPDVIVYIKTPSEKVQHLAIQKKFSLLFKINNPSPSVQKIIKKVKKEIAKLK